MRKKTIKRQRALLICGIVLALAGTAEYLLSAGPWHINRGMQLPTLVSGMEYLCAGAILLGVWWWTRKNLPGATESENDSFKKHKKIRRPMHGRGPKARETSYLP